MGDSELELSLSDFSDGPAPPIALKPKPKQFLLNLPPKNAPPVGSSSSVIKVAHEPQLTTDVPLPDSISPLSPSMRRPTAASEGAIDSMSKEQIDFDPSNIRLPTRKRIQRGIPESTSSSSKLSRLSRKRHPIIDKVELVPYGPSRVFPRHHRPEKSSPALVENPPLDSDLVEDPPVSPRIHQRPKPRISTAVQIHPKAPTLRWEEDLTLRPVEDLTPMLMEDLTPRPVKDPNPKPVKGSGLRWGKDPSLRPVEDPTPMPVGDLTPRPVEDPSPEEDFNPKPEKGSALRWEEDPFLRPVEDLTPRPMEDPNSKPVEDITPKPVKNPTTRPVKGSSLKWEKDPTLRPVEDHNTRPVEDIPPRLVEDITPKPVKVPNPKPVKGSVLRWEKDPSLRPVEDLTPRPMEDSNSRPVKDPTTKPVKGSGLRWENDPTLRPVEDLTPMPVDVPLTSPRPFKRPKPGVYHSPQSDEVQPPNSDEVPPPRSRGDDEHQTEQNATPEKHPHSELPHFVKFPPQSSSQENLFSGSGSKNSSSRQQGSFSSFNSPYTPPGKPAAPIIKVTNDPSASPLPLYMRRENASSLSQFDPRSSEKFSASEQINGLTLPAMKRNRRNSDGTSTGENSESSNDFDYRLSRDHAPEKPAPIPVEVLPPVPAAIHLPKPTIFQGPPPRQIEAEPASGHHLAPTVYQAFPSASAEDTPPSKKKKQREHSDENSAPAPVIEPPTPIIAETPSPTEPKIQISPDYPIALLPVGNRKVRKNHILITYSLSIGVTGGIFNKSYTYVLKHQLEALFCAQTKGRFPKTTVAIDPGDTPSRESTHPYYLTLNKGLTEFVLHRDLEDGRTLSTTELSANPYGTEFHRHLKSLVQTSSGKVKLVARKPGLNGNKELALDFHHQLVIPSKKNCILIQHGVPNPTDVLVFRKIDQGESKFEVDLYVNIEPYIVFSIALSIYLANLELAF